MKSFRLRPDDPRLTAYLHGEIKDPEELRAIESCLQTNPELQQHLREMSELGRLLELGFRQEPLPDAVRPSSNGHFRTPAVRPVPRFRRVAAHLLPLALAASFLVALTLLLRNQESPTNIADPAHHPAVATLPHPDEPNKEVLLSPLPLASGDGVAIVASPTDDSSADDLEPAAEGLAMTSPEAFRPDSPSTRSHAVAVGAQEMGALSHLQEIGSKIPTPSPAQPSPLIFSPENLEATAGITQRGNSPANSLVVDGALYSGPRHGVAWESMTVHEPGTQAFPERRRLPSPTRGASADSEAESPQLPSVEGRISTEGAARLVDGTAVALPQREPTVSAMPAEVVDNPFLETTRHPLVHLSLSVGKRSLSLIRQLLESGQQPSVATVRLEEMINSFAYQYEYPVSRQKPIRLSLQDTVAPWNEQHRLLRLVLTAWSSRHGQVAPTGPAVPNDPFAVFAETTPRPSVVARQCRLHLEFNPALIAAHRILGYENQLTPGQQVRRAGEYEIVVEGQVLTVLIELIPAGGEIPAEEPALVYQKTPTLRARARETGEMLTATLQYQVPGNESILTEHIPYRGPHLAWAEVDDDFRFASAVAAFGLILRDSPHRGWATVDSVLRIASQSLGQDPDGERAAFLDLVRRAGTEKK